MQRIVFICTYKEIGLECYLLMQFYTIQNTCVTKWLINWIIEYAICVCIENSNMICFLEVQIWKAKLDTAKSYIIQILKAY